MYQTKLCKLSLVGGLSLYKVRGWLAYLFSSHSSYSGLSWSNVDLGMQGQKQLKGLWEMRSRLGWVCLAEWDTKIQFQDGMFGFCLRGHRGIWWCGHVLWDELGDTRVEMEGKKSSAYFPWWFLFSDTFSSIGWCQRENVNPSYVLFSFFFLRKVLTSPHSPWTLDSSSSRLEYQ